MSRDLVILIWLGMITIAIIILGYKVGKKRIFPCIGYGRWKRMERGYGNDDLFLH